eukprot:COSAG05_NODE_17593_length_322_cov_16.636771_1_plen_98_part_10
MVDIKRLWPLPLKFVYLKRVVNIVLCALSKSSKRQLLRDLSNFQPCMANILHYFTYRGAQISSSEQFQATVTAWAQPGGLGGVCGRWQAPASGWQPAA